MKALLKVLSIALAVLGLTLSEAQAFPPTGFSRSCRLSDVPMRTRTIISDTFNQKAYGVRLDQVNAYLAQFTYANESITADYATLPLFWLWSVSARYTVDRWAGTYSVTMYPPSPWNPGSAWDSNRTWFMSVRSGSGVDPGISDIWQPVAQDLGLTYGEVGGHAFWDSPGGTMYHLPDSYATDCNCLQWGFGWTYLGMPNFGGIAANIIIGLILFQCY